MWHSYVTTLALISVLPCQVKTHIKKAVFSDEEIECFEQVLYGILGYIHISYFRKLS